ncbi:UNKNOWN [Stylonychia lemnae]|uniref:Uncharacterized protein n=1 Tax=Stylonychia lemnae TaxID=5949 RepID=A0A078AX40_STYLE|nr:UNKNOWN [Stylonychia lemnae]|eukprot:CDW85358.1 UNKNOWN [Stylonychia lemnae]
MKNKNLKFTQFEKDHVLQLHKPLERREQSIIENISKNEDEKSLIDEDQGGSDNEKKDEPSRVGDSDDKNSTQLIKAKKDSKLSQSPKAYKYYYEKYLFHDRNMTLDIQKNKRAYFSSFKSVPRERQEYVDNLQNIDTLNQKPRVSQSPSQEYIDKRHGHHNSIHTLEDLRSKSTIQKKQKTLDLTKNQRQKEKSELVIDDHDQSFNDSSNILNPSPYKNASIIHQSSSSIKNSPSPQKMRQGWDNAHGMLDLNKQSERKFVFENLIRINEHRFDYIQLPVIYSKNRKVVGDANFGKGSSRKDLFKLPEYQPSYNANYEITQRKNPQLVNMNVKQMKEIYHNIQ